MANQPDPDKILYGIRMPRTLHARLVKLAAKRGESLKDTVLAILNKSVENIVLDENDYKEIAEATRKAVEKNGRRYSAGAYRNASRTGKED